MAPYNALTQICSSKSDWFEGCGMLFGPDPKRRSTLCNDCKKKYGVQLRKKTKNVYFDHCKELLCGLPESPRFRRGATRIPVAVLQPKYGDNVLLEGRYSRHGNYVQVRPHYPVKHQNDNSPVIDWYDVETGTNKKELLVTGLWLEQAIASPVTTPYFSGRIGERANELRIEIYRQGDVYPVFYAHG